MYLELFGGSAMTEYSIHDFTSVLCSIASVLKLF